MKIENFSNNEIDLEKIPTWETVNFQSISPRYQGVIWINTLITFLFFLVGLAVIWVLDENPTINFFIAASASLLLVFCLILVLNLFALKKRGYAVREQDILYRTGVLTTSTIIIPFKHIQHVKIKQTILGRFFGLSIVEVFTSGSAQDMGIRGIDQEKAKILQEYISEKISSWKGHSELSPSEE